MPLLPSRPSPLRPHPLCPDCGYDVADQVERGRLRCPECGAQFDRDEVDWERRPGDWSPLQGFLRVGVLLGLRSLAFVPVWAGFLLLAGPWIAFRLFMSFFVLAILGLVVGLVYGWGVDERAGFVSGVLTAFASLCCLVALAVGAHDRLRAGPGAGGSGVHGHRCAVDGGNGHHHPGHDAR